MIRLIITADDELYERLRSDGITVLYDDRDETPGVKFNDADLLGMPLRVTVSPRTLEKESVELKRRSEAESALVPLEGSPVEIGTAVGR